MKEYQSPMCAEIIKNVFGFFALIKQNTHLLIENKYTNELRFVYYPLHSEANKYNHDEINSLLKNYFISKIVSLNIIDDYPVFEPAKDPQYYKLLHDTQILLDSKNKPILYKEKYNHM